MTNLKDKITNVCGIIVALAGGVLLIEQNPATANLIPDAIAQIIQAAGVISVALIGYLTGKAADGTPKKPV